MYLELSLCLLQVPVVVSGYEVPAGTFFLNAIQNIVQLEKNFKDADQFKPERFVRGDPEQSDAHAFAHLPFGHGKKTNASFVS